MKTAETKSAAQQHNTAAQSFFNQGQEQAFFSKHSADRTPFFPSTASNPIQFKSLSESIPFFSPSPAATIQAKCATCEAEEQSPVGAEPAAEPPTVQRAPAFESEGAVQAKAAPKAEAIAPPTATPQTQPGSDTKELKQEEEAIAETPQIQMMPAFSSADNPGEADDSNAEQPPVQFRLVIGQQGDAYEREAEPKLTLSTPDIGAAATPGNASKTDNGVQPATQTPPGATTEAGSGELAQFLQQADAQREGLLQSGEQKKQQVRAAALAEKQNAQQSISTEEKRLEEICNQAVERIQQSTARTGTQILSEKDAKIAATRAAAQTELNNLRQTVLEKQNALRNIGDEKAKAISSVGQEQGQLAISVSNQKASQAQTVANSKAQQYAGSQHGGDIASSAQQMASKAAPGMQKAGGDMAQAASKGANELAGSFQKGASQLAQKFNQALEDGQKKILQAQDQTISVLNQIAQESVSKLEASKNEAVAKLQAGKQNAVQQLRTSAQGAISNIDKSAENACAEVDKATAQATGKLNNFTAEVSASLKTNKDEAGAETVQAAQAQLSQFQTQWDAALDRFGTDATQILQDQAKQLHEQVSKQVDQAAAPVQKAAADSETKATDAYSQVSQKMAETASKATETMQKVTGEAQKELQNKINESESKFNAGLIQGQAQLTGMVGQGLAKHDEVLSSLSTNISSLAKSIGSAIGNFFKELGNFLKGVWDGFWEAIGGIFKGIGSLLSKYWENLKKGDFWTWVITIVVVVVIILAIVFPPFGAALLKVLAVIGKILLYGGILVGALAALYYIYKAIFTPGLSWYERGKYAGKALFEILLLWLSWKGAAKGAAAAGKVGTAARLAELVPDAKLLARLQAIVSDEAKLIELLEKWKDAEKLADILEKAGDLARAEALLKEFGSVEELWNLLKMPGMSFTDVEFLLARGMSAGEIKDLVKIPGITGERLSKFFNADSNALSKIRAILVRRPITLRKIMGDADYEDYEKAIQIIKNNHPEIANIPTDDLIAIHGYTGADYARLNNALRNGDILELIELEEYISKAIKGLRELPSHSGTFLRGENGTQALYLGKEGEVLTMQGFTSTSTNPRAAFPGNVQLTIAGQTGKDVKSISQVPTEDEILFMAGLRFRVDSVHFDGVTYSVHLTEIP